MRNSNRPRLSLSLVLSQVAILAACSGGAPADSPKAPTGPTGPTASPAVASITVTDSVLLDTWGDSARLVVC